MGRTNNILVRKKLKTYRWLLLLLILIIAKPIMVGDTPLFFTNKGAKNQWSSGVSRLIPYAPSQILAEDRLLSPLSRGQQGIHWLGTDHLGRDVAAMWMESLRYSFFLSLLAALIALIIGFTLGGLAGYYGNGWKSSALWVHFFIVTLVFVMSFLTWHYLFYYFPTAFLQQSFLLFIGLITVGFVIWRLLDRMLLKLLPNQTKTYKLDKIILGVIEIVESIPPLLLILTILGITSIGSYWQVSILLGCLGWMTMARFVRAETLSLSTKKYIQDYRKLGFSDFYVLSKHIFPQVFMMTAILFSFSIAAFVMTESFLSFLGIGVPENFSSWGNMLNIARRFPSAWWIGLFPGLGIFFLIFVYQDLARKLNPGSNSF